MGVKASIDKELSLSPDLHYIVLCGRAECTPTIASVDRESLRQLLVRSLVIPSLIRSVSSLDSR
jgi:hypothetical protein